MVGVEQSKMRRTGTCWACLLISVACLMPAMTGCDESVDPIIGTDIPFTLWGFLNARADTQRVRVYPVSSELNPDGSQGIDATVSSTNLTTGERREWTYEAVVFDSLNTGHIFWSPFRANHEHRYRLEVTRSDGATSSVEVTVPPPVSFEVNVQEDELIIPVRIEGDAPNLIGMRVTYHAQNVPPQNAWPPSLNIHPSVDLPVSISYDNLARQEGGAWIVNIDMERDFQILRAIFGAACLITNPRGSAPDIWLNRMEFSAIAADSTWTPPGGTFDPNILAVPETFTNVENGYGFFGAGQGIRHEWVPSTDARRNAGFNFEPRCDFTAMPDEPECLDPPVPCLGDNARSIWELWLR